MNAWLLVSLLAAAPFEGVVHMKVKTSLGEGTVKVSVAPVGIRSDGNLRLGERDLKTTVVVRADEPQSSYFFDATGNTWTKQPDTELKGDGPYTARKLAPEKVAGILCQHVVLTDKNGGEIEYWTTRQLVTNEKQAAMLALAQKTPTDVAEALKSVDALGFVLKMQSKRKGKMDLSLLTERIERKKLAAKLFSVALKAP